MISINWIKENLLFLIKDERFSPWQEICIYVNINKYDFFFPCIDWNDFCIFQIFFQKLLSDIIKRKTSLNNFHFNHCKVLL